MPSTAATNELEFAWACGFFVGEGTVIYRHGPRQTHRGLQAVQKDREPLERLQRAFGGIGAITLNDSGSQCYVWKAANWTEIEPVLHRMLPYLCSARRAKALALLSDPPRRLQAPTRRLEVAAA